MVDVSGFDKYHKIDTVYKRSETGDRRLIEGEYRDKAVEYLKDNQWLITEKIDGTNIRIIYDGHSIMFGGRTDKAIIPPRLLKVLEEDYSTNEFEELMEEIFGDKTVVIFGEGYGANIQKVGSKYLPDSNGFRAFDILVDGKYYLEQPDFYSVCRKLGIPTAPLLATMTIPEAIEFVKSKPKSTIGDCIMEGVVARPEVRLYTVDKRIIVKIKVCDFCEEKDSNESGN